MHYTPTLKVMETSRNIQNFVKENKGVLFEIFRPLAPYIVGLMFIDVIVTIFIQKLGSMHEFPLGNILSAYFFVPLGIAWHRVVIQGPDKYQRMNPFKPTKNELLFTGMGILFFLIMPLVGFAIGVSSIIFGIIGFIIGFAALFIGAFYLGYRICFYLPAKAVNASITFKELFFLSKGYVWKLFATAFMASLKIFSLMILYMLIFYIGGGYAINYLFAKGVVTQIVGFLLALPITLYFQPLLAAYNVTALSNYYMHAMQNKTEAHRSA